MDNLYIINHISPILKLNELNNTNSLPFKRNEPSKINQMLLWHLHLGHINLRKIQSLVQNGSLGSLEVEAPLVSESSLEGKIT